MHHRKVATRAQARRVAQDEKAPHSHGASERTFFGSLRVLPTGVLLIVARHARHAILLKELGRARVVVFGQAVHAVRVHQVLIHPVSVLLSVEYTPPGPAVISALVEATEDARTAPDLRRCSF
jgi:hypothetical protein